MVENNNFNLIRLLAASIVVYQHATAYVNPPQIRAITFLVYALPGVTIFFIVSGFLVTRSFINSNSLADYFGRRALRIYPGLFANFVFILALLFATGTLPLDTLWVAPFWEWLACSVVSGSDFYGSVITGWGPSFAPLPFYKEFPSGVLWTLSIEIGFYLLVPMLFFRGLRESRFFWPAILFSITASLAAASIQAGRMASGSGQDFSTQLLFVNPIPYFWIFLLGSVASIVWDKIKSAFEGLFVMWAVAYFVLTIADLYTFGSEFIDITRFASPLGTLRVVALAGLVLSFAHSFPSLGKPFRGTDLSFGVYLYHVQIIATLAALEIKGRAWEWLVIYAGSFVLAAISWFCIEKPAKAIKNYLTRRALSRPNAEQVLVANDA